MNTPKLPMQCWKKLWANLIWPWLDTNQEYVGKQVKKKSGKPFKSGRKVNTVRGVVTHPIKNEPAFTFEEDNSYVSATMCEKV